MPHYVYHCDDCGANKAEWHWKIPKKVPDTVKCLCGKTAHRSWRAEHMPEPDNFRPYYTDNMGHDVVYVRSRREERRLCKERHLERVT